MSMPFAPTRTLSLVAALLVPAALAAQGSVAGRVSVVDRDGRPAEDVSQSVVWLTGTRVATGHATKAEMATQGKQFVPHLVVAPVGSTVAFPNHDGFKHNVFSLSPEGTFDLGLYARGEGKSRMFDQAGVIRVYCNVHAQMRGLVVVVPSAFAAQPGADGSFRLDSVPPGDYTLHAWHERAAAEVTQAIRVTTGNDAALSVTLDAHGYRQVQHKNKDGKAYTDRSSRY